MRHGWMRGAALAGAVAFAAAPLAAQERHVEVHTSGVSRGWLGFTFRTDGGPMVIERVLPGSPAQRAGVAAGDTVVQVDGRAATDAEMAAMRTRLHPGDAVRLRVRHGGAVAERTVTAAARPGSDVVILNRTMRISGDSMRDPVIIQLDSLGDLPGLRGGEVRRLLDSLGIRLGEMGDLRGRTEFHVRMDSAQRRRIRIRLDTMRVHLDSLALHMDSLRVRLRHIQPGVGEFEIMTPEGAQRLGGRGNVIIRRDTFTFRRGESFDRVPFVMDLGRRALGGAEMVDLNDKLGAYFSSRAGALVVQVSPGTPAARAGLEPGDVVVRAGDRAVQSVGDLRQAASRAGDGSLRLQVIRHGRRRDLVMPWEASRLRTAPGEVRIRTRERTKVQQQ
ncbi:MAG: hypothetical protein JWM27_4988 [Gemmatimonadetes bacterium]|nr:hypothetical protein [Gemmatimonadota bacterium]